jgi:REP element-mobilizing transposase RayT
MNRKPHLRWRSRGYLPHCDSAHHIVFSLSDAMPPAARPASAMHADRALDSGHGSCLLREPRCASLVEEALLHADAERYRLLAWCVMPNHVHVVAEQIEGFPLGDIVQAWKSASAHEINHALRRKGRLWRREYFDRFMRDDDHLSTTIAYVENNPVAAKLVETPAEWAWSSARRR